MGELQSALDACAAEDLHGLVAAQLLDRTAELVRARNRIDAELARTVRRADLVQAAEHDGLKTMASWLRGHTRLSPGVAAAEGRSVSLAKHDDGTLSLRGQLDAVGGEKVQAALESFVQADRPAGDLRTRAQQLGDALVQLADVALASGRLPILRTVKPHVIVTIGLADLVDPSTGPGAAQTGFGAAISAARARWLACDGNVTRVIIGPEGQPLDVGRSRRVVPPHIRRAVELRDRHCVFAGCAAPSHWCDVHHVLEWDADHGDTSVENSGLLCERHHTKVHHGFRIERDPDGRWHTYRPDGTEIIIGPPLLLTG